MTEWVVLLSLWGPENTEQASVSKHSAETAEQAAEAAVENLRLGVGWQATSARVVDFKHLQIFAVERTPDWQVARPVLTKPGGSCERCGKQHPHGVSARLCASCSAEAQGHG